MRGLTIAAACVLSPVAIHAAVPAADPAEAAIRAAMLASAAGWSAGDLDRFMAIYAADAIFVTGNGLIRGNPPLPIITARALQAARTAVASSASTFSI
jgi:hypothetical protein